MQKVWFFAYSAWMEDFLDAVKMKFDIGKKYNVAGGSSV